MQNFYKCLSYGFQEVYFNYLFWCAIFDRPEPKKTLYMYNEVENTCYENNYRTYSFFKYLSSNIKFHCW